MKFNREHLEELTLQKIKEVNDEAGYRSYLEVPEMVNIVASIIEEKFVDNKWEACADMLYVYADEVKCGTHNQALWEAACQDIEKYKELKNGTQSYE